MKNAYFVQYWDFSNPKYDKVLVSKIYIGTVEELDKYTKDKAIKELQFLHKVEDNPVASTIINKKLLLEVIFDCVHYSDYNKLRYIAQSLDVMLFRPEHQDLYDIFTSIDKFLYKRHISVLGKLYKTDYKDLDNIGLIKCKTFDTETKVPNDVIAFIKDISSDKKYKIEKMTKDDDKNIVTLYIDARETDKEQPMNSFTLSHIKDVLKKEDVYDFFIRGNKSIWANINQYLLSHGIYSNYITYDNGCLWFSASFDYAKLKKHEINR